MRKTLEEEKIAWLLDITVQFGIYQFGSWIGLGCKRKRNVEARNRNGSG
jgi:hypothetical protein